MEMELRAWRKGKIRMQATFRSLSEEHFLSPTLLIIREAGNFTNPCNVGCCSFNSDQSLRVSFFLMVSTFEYTWKTKTVDVPL